MANDLKGNCIDVENKCDILTKIQNKLDNISEEFKETKKYLSHLQNEQSKLTAQLDKFENHLKLAKNIFEEVEQSSSKNETVEERNESMSNGNVLKFNSMSSFQIQ